MGNQNLALILILNCNIITTVAAESLSETRHIGGHQVESVGLSLKFNGSHILLNRDRPLLVNL